MSGNVNKMNRPLSRRTILRGAGGAAIALPWLEAMLPRRAHGGDRAGQALHRDVLGERHHPVGVDADAGNQRDRLRAVADPRRRWRRTRPTWS